MVDEDVAVRSLLEPIFARPRTLYFADDGQMALRLVARHPIDLTLLELGLPDLDGIEVLRRLRRLLPRLPVIIVTGHSRHDAAVEAANLGVSGYFLKPFDVEALKTRLEEVLPRGAIHPISQGLPNGQAAGLAASVVHYIQAHHGAPLTMEKVARALHVSPHRLKVAFRQEIGVPFKDYLIRIRIGRAVRMLRETREPIKAIAFEAGYRSLAHFYQHFSRLTGRTRPSIAASGRPRSSTPDGFSKNPLDFGNPFPLTPYLPSASVPPNRRR